MPVKAPVKNFNLKSVSSLLVQNSLQSKCDHSARYVAVYTMFGLNCHRSQCKVCLYMSCHVSEWITACLYFSKVLSELCVFCSVGGGASLVNLTGIFYLLTRQSHQRLTVKEKIRSTNGDTWCTPSMLSAMKKTQPCLCHTDAEQHLFTGLLSERVSIVETHSQKFKWFFLLPPCAIRYKMYWVEKKWMKKMNKAWNLLEIVNHYRKRKNAVN